MVDADKPSSGTPQVRAAALIDEAEALCRVHDHITRVIGDLEIPDDTFTDQYANTYPGELGFESVIRTLLYQKVCGFSQREVQSR